jgi:hypothetical protein
MSQNPTNFPEEDQGALERINRLRESLRGPMRVIAEYEAASDDEKDNWIDSIAKAYHDRELLRGQLRSQGVAKGSQRFGNVTVEWDVQQDENRARITLIQYGEIKEKFELVVGEHSPQMGAQKFETQRFRLVGASGFFLLAAPADGQPGTLTITINSSAGNKRDILAAW